MRWLIDLIRQWWEDRVSPAWLTDYHRHIYGRGQIQSNWDWDSWLANRDDDL